MTTELIKIKRAIVNTTSLFWVFASFCVMIVFFNICADDTVIQRNLLLSWLVILLIILMIRYHNLKKLSKLEQEYEKSISHHIRWSFSRDQLDN